MSGIQTVRLRNPPALKVVWASSFQADLTDGSIILVGPTTAK